jgi:hypothetical protein
VTITESAVWRPCSDRSRERGDPIAATAGRGERWFLVEIDGAWGPHAFLESGLDPAVARALVQRVEAAGMRLLAIRRTGRRADERRRDPGSSWAVVDTRPGREAISWGSFSALADLLDVPLDGSAGAPSDEPLIAVCTHARHDQCCAVRGRPIVETLAAAFPEQTWECSHLGGDRFAATFVVFPTGLLYGRAPVEEAVHIVDRAIQGRIEAPWFRGRVALTAVEQAAQAYARAASGDDRVDAYATADIAGRGDGWLVRLDHAGGSPVEVELAPALSPPLLSTCAATIPVRVPQYELVGVRASRGDA